MTGWGKQDIMCIVRTKRKGELCFIFLFGAGAGITSLASIDLQCWQSIINTHHRQLNTNEYHRMIRSQQDVYQWMNFLQCVCTASGRRDPKVCDCILLIHSVFLQEAGGCKASWKRVDESRGNQTRWWQGHGFTPAPAVDKAITHPYRTHISTAQQQQCDLCVRFQIL